MKCKTILVVDDEPDILETIVEVLENFRVETAGTFNQATGLLETRAYDMAILDIMGVKGLDLLATAVRKKHPGRNANRASHEPRVYSKINGTGSCFVYSERGSCSSGFIAFGII